MISNQTQSHTSTLVERVWRIGRVDAFRPKGHAVACRGSWMPGTYEVFGCPPTKKLFLRTTPCRTFL